MTQGKDGRCPKTAKAVAEWLNPNRGEEIVNEIAKIERLSNGEATQLYRAWESDVHTHLRAGTVPPLFQFAIIEPTSREIARQILDKRDFFTRYGNVSSSKSDAELRDAALRKRARKSAKSSPAHTQNHESRNSSNVGIRSTINTTSTNFYTHPLANYSLQDEMSKAGIRSIEELSRVLNSIRADLTESHTVAQRFDVSVEPEVLRAVLSRLMLSAAVSVHAAGGQLRSKEKEQFVKYLNLAGVVFVPIVQGKDSQSTLNAVADIIYENSKIDGRFDASGAVSAGGLLATLFDKNLYKKSGSLPDESILINTRNVIASVLVWSAASVDPDAETAWRDSLLGRSFESWEQQIRGAWLFGRALQTSDH